MLVALNVETSVRDETYVIDLCDSLLGQKAQRQHRFDFLRGDPGKNRVGAKLPVDAYYPDLGLVIEYREPQHSRAVPIFDKQDRVTVSGVPRREQRAIYDQRRRDELPKHGIELVELSHADFGCDRRGRLLRHRTNDLAVLQSKLSRWLGGD